MSKYTALQAAGEALRMARIKADGQVTRNSADNYIKAAAKFHKAARAYCNEGKK